MKSGAKSILPKLALSFFSLFFMVGAIEGGAYIWERSQASGPYAWELVASRRINLVEYPSPGAGYTLFEPNEKYKWQDIEVSINEHGLRGPAYPFEKPPNTFRILNLGDSIAMGWGVREEDTYGRLLENHLNGQFSEKGIKYEIINAGVPGWNLENELAFLEGEGLLYEPDIILLDVTIVNDIYGKSALLKNQRTPLNEWLRVNTYTWPFLSIQMQWLQARSEQRDRIDVIDPPKNASSYFPLDPSSEKWDEIWRSISAMDDLAKENDARLVVLLFPLEFQVLDPSFSTVPQQVLGEKASESGVPVVNLLPVFQEACHDKAGGACMLEDRYLFADVWMHPSALGNQLVFQVVNDFLQDPNGEFLK